MRQWGPHALALASTRMFEDLRKGHRQREQVDVVSTPTPTHPRCRIVAERRACLMTDLAAHARAIIDANLYLTLGTTDPDGRPWTSPVYFAPVGDREFCWMSATDARHSRHLARRSQVSMVIFDSTVAPYHGRAVYAVGEVRELSGSDLDRALAVYPRPGGQDATPVAREEVTAPAPYRLYLATASDLWVLCPREPRQPCPLHGLAKDHRTRVPA